MADSHCRATLSPRILLRHGAAHTTTARRAHQHGAREQRYRRHGCAVRCRSCRCCTGRSSTGGCDCRCRWRSVSCSDGGIATTYHRCHSHYSMLLCPAHAAVQVLRWSVLVLSCGSTQQASKSARIAASGSVAARASCTTAGRARYVKAATTRLATRRLLPSPQLPPLLLPSSVRTSAAQSPIQVSRSAHARHRHQACDPPLLASLLRRLLLRIRNREPHARTTASCDCWMRRTRAAWQRHSRSSEE